MSEKVSLRKQPQQKTAEGVGLRPVTVDAPGLRGQLPFPSGKPLLTPAEAAVWKKAGLTEGELPPDISPANKRLIEELLKPKDLPAGMKDLPPLKPQSLESLSEEKQAELVNILKQVREQSPSAMVEEADMFIPSGPGIGEAMAMAQEAAASSPSTATKGSTVDPANIRLIDDRVKKQALVTDNTLTPEEKGYKVPELYNCPHCGWDLKKTDDIVVTKEDKQVYVASIVTGSRFVKTYKLFDGALSITFRGLLAWESELVLRQLYIDNANGKLNAPPEFYKKTREYRLALALASLVSSAGVSNAVQLPPFKDGYDVDFTNEESTGLPELVMHLDEKVIKTETLRNVLLSTHEGFDLLTHKIAYGAKDADFSSATADAR
jgi:hypothetical protein